jgi:hypothetical protein
VGLTLDICAIDFSAPRQIIPVNDHSGKLAKTSVTRIHEEIWISALRARSAGYLLGISREDSSIFPSNFVKRLRIDTSPVQRYSSLRKGHYTPKNRVLIARFEASQKGLRCEPYLYGVRERDREIYEHENVNTSMR